MRVLQTLIVSIFGLLLIGVSAQTKLPTKEDIEREIRRIFSAFDSGDVGALLKNAQEGINYGWRNSAARIGSVVVDPQEAAAHGAEAYREAMKRFFDSMEYYHVRFEELHTSVEGNIGLGWGVYIEDFKIKGQPPEKARVRFTTVLKNEGESWDVLMRHSDIEPFDEHGRYLPQLTRVR